MGLELESVSNESKSETVKISKASSRVEAYVIPTDEEMMIALDTLNLI